MEYDKENKLTNQKINVIGSCRKPCNIKKENISP